MATTLNVNINIGSSIGYKIAKGPSGMVGNAPQMQTVKTLNGVYYTTSTSFTASSGPVLSVNVGDLVDFVSPIGVISSKQNVIMTNNGNSLLNVYDLLYTYNNNIGPRFYFSNNATILNKNTIIIPPGESASFQVAYLGAVVGTYTNYFVILSDNTSGYYKVDTRQVIRNTTGLIISPASFNTTTTQIGQTSSVTYKLTPVFNETAINAKIPYVTSLQGNRAWSIDSTATNSISVKFNSWEVNNVNGTYVSTLTVVANGITTSTVNTAVVNINAALNKNLSTWVSPLSSHNSIIGVSYDLENGNRVLTIGVGMGGNNSPLVEDEYNYESVSNLGLGTGDTLDPYPTWANVCKIKFTGNEQTYYSGDYKVKTTAAYDYTSYFGDYSKPGSMFIVKDDGYGSITIELNHLRELS